MLSGRLRAAVAGLAIAVLAGVTPAAAQAAFVKGSPSGGDPYFPKAGNGGYDVSRYNLHLRYQPSVNRLVGKATIREFQETEIIIAPSIKTEGKLFQTVQSVGMGTR